MTKISYKVQENFLRRYFVKHFLAAVLLALPDIFQHWTYLGTAAKIATIGIEPAALRFWCSSLTN
jgi:hypothetical protein